MATLYLNDLADVVRDGVDSRFEFVRYAESLAGSQATFDLLAQALAAPLTLVDKTLHALTMSVIDKHQPTVVLLSVPFPGAMYGALVGVEMVQKLIHTSTAIFFSQAKCMNLDVGQTLGRKKRQYQLKG